MNAAKPIVTPLYPRPCGLTRPLRVVLAAPPKAPAWVLAFHALAMDCDWVELITLTAPDAILPEVSGVPASLRAYVAFEHAVLGSNRSLDPVEIPDDQDVQSDEPHDTPLPDRIRALLPDLVILIGPRAWATALAGDVPWGCWLVDGSLIDARHAGLSLLGPMLRRESATHMTLMLQEETAGSIELAASWGKTRRTSFLFQREDAFRKVPALLLRSLHRLAEGHLPTPRRTVATLQLPPQRPMGRPAGMRVLLSTLRASPRWLTARRRNGRIGWTLVVRLGGSRLDPDAPAVGSHALLKAPKGWWSDPCVVMAQGRKLIFVEEMIEPKLKKANIACVELVNGGARRLGTVLEEAGHLSFPQVFEWRGQQYMTVESGYDRRVSLYRANDFPLGWTRVRDLISGRACADPTLHHHEGRWYLFVNVAENNNSTCDELFLFVADCLDGPFYPHPASPIVCDVRRARMAGRLFQHRGRLIRPAQDCGPGYGNAIVFHEVLELGPTVYRERRLSRLAPYLTRPVDGCHTYNCDGGIEVLDVLGHLPGGASYLQVFDDVEADDPPSFQQVPNRFATSGPAHPGAPPR
ncbi:glucosamine inositolphosphorylceramide transferase family protein [Montanilutibacter psychrotolerans]|uniref:Glucosamine inositolphosphorylceramide transferase 1 N-terminal domain-containing protein n=1 Tax=Montanilutibacter psychrotolerans TaxID=1327343 RepID=A0A3M8SPP9_9GAMM|nr:hypothetical protein [Lysobacter psychrotolerans]RNF83281.1 hypothetical protein EER27_12375 [Lysobacter psychrotolerans]